MPAANNSGILNELSQERKKKVLGGETNFRVNNSTAATEQGQRTIAEPEPVSVATPAPTDPTVEEAEAKQQVKTAAAPKAARTAVPKASA